MDCKLQPVHSWCGAGGMQPGRLHAGSAGVSPALSVVSRAHGTTVPEIDSGLQVDDGGRDGGRKC